MSTEPAASEQLLMLLVGAGHLARSHGCFAQARQLFEQLQVTFPERASPWLGLALLEIDRQDYARASSRCRAALAVAPDYALARAWLGVCQFALGEGSQAVRTFSSMDAHDDAAGRLAASMLQLIHALDRA
ncbi:MAG TPA: tetratricopeptide repeat protein [Stenotrophomonas sp.]|nr:tetratricopeptide repeat protein [Stenotrophomonas sp.]